jgi:hypothetical protein
VKKSEKKENNENDTLQERCAGTTRALMAIAHDVAMMRMFGQRVRVQVEALQIAHGVTPTTCDELEPT